jgi:hypothetical protein
MFRNAVGEAQFQSDKYRSKEQVCASKKNRSLQKIIQVKRFTDDPRKITGKNFDIGKISLNK